MKLIEKQHIAFLFIVFSLVINITIQTRSRMRMKSRSKFGKFHSRAETQFLSNLWKAPGSPAVESPDYLKPKIDPHFDEDYSNVLVEDWLSVASPIFKNEQKFPVFFYPNHGIGEALVTTGDYTRINEKFQERPPYLDSSAEFKTDPNAPPERTLFWFRLSDKYLYFAESKQCINVLGNIMLTNILHCQKSEGECFDAQLKDGTKYKYCAQTKEVLKKFLCLIQEKLRFDLDNICKGEDASEDPTLKQQGKIKEKVITQPYILIPMARGECNEDWHYRNHGKDWECLCKEGKRQSPIDLPPTKKAIGSPVRALFQFEKISTMIDQAMPERQIKEGDTLRLQYHEGALRIYGPYLGKTVTMDGGVYYAQEISFHTPSEHKINGETFPLEMSIVHYGQTIGDTAKQLVLSFLFKRSPGIYNKFLERLDIFNLPNPLDKFRDLQSDLFVPDVFFNVNEDSSSNMIPFSFYTYEGSLTRPPCNENTIHYVASEPIGLSSTVLELFKEALRIPDLQTETGAVIVNDTSIMHSNRVTQRLYGRSVFYYDSKLNGCPTIKRMRKGGKQAVHGHYERKQGKVEQFFFVEGSQPSGLPGAFVVTEQEAKNSGDPSLADHNDEAKEDAEEEDEEDGKKKKDRRLVGDGDSSDDDDD